MKNSIFYLTIFVLGLLVGRIGLYDDMARLGDFINYILYGMMAVVGISIGSDQHISGQFKLRNIRLLLVPITVVLGTALGMGIYHLLFPFPDATNLFAIGFGMGY